MRGTYSPAASGGTAVHYRSDTVGRETSLPIFCFCGYNKLYV